MRRALLLALILLFLGFHLCWFDAGPRLTYGLSFSGVSVGGPIIANTTWTLVESPYVVSADVVVLIDVFLTVEPGVTVMFGNGTSIIVDGTLIIQGDSVHRTTFTSNASSPALGDWGSIRTRTGGHIVGFAPLTTVEYSAGGIEFPADSSYIISDCVFRANGVGISGSNLTVTGCTFEKNANAIDAVNVQVADCEFFDNVNAVAGSGVCAAENITAWNNSGNGIQISGPVIDCLVHDNGGNGIVGNSVANCLVYGNGGCGAIGSASVINCIAFNNSGGGIAGGSVLNCSSHNNGGYGVHCNSIANCSIHNNGGIGVEAPALMVNCSIHDNGGDGVSMAYGGTVTNSSMFNNKGYGVFGLMDGVVSQCSIYNNQAGGVHVWAGTTFIYVLETQIYNNLVGIFIASPTLVSAFYVPLNVSDCIIRNNLKGGIVTDELFYMPGGLPDVYLMIAHTVIDSNGPFGIRFNATLDTQIVYSLIQEMSDCTITNQTVGAVGGFGNVKGSNITGNSQIGLDVYDFDTLHEFEKVTNISGNNIYGNGIFGIKNHFLFGQDLNATMNWWGTANTTEIAAFIYDYYDDYTLSRVLFEPYLTSPIPEFPSFVVLPLFVIATLFTSIVCKRKYNARA